MLEVHDVSFVWGHLEWQSKEKLSRALQQRYLITLRLPNNEIHGNDELMGTQTKKIQRAVSTGVGVDIKISKSHIAFTSCCERGSSLFSSLMTLAPRLLSNVGARVLPGFATVDTGTIKEKVDMSREWIIQDAFNDNTHGYKKTPRNWFRYLS